MAKLGIQLRLSDSLAHPLTSKPHALNQDETSLSVSAFTVSRGERNYNFSISFSNIHKSFISSEIGKLSQIILPSQIRNNYFLLICQGNATLIWKSKKNHFTPSHHIVYHWWCSCGANPQELLPALCQWLVLSPASPCGLSCTGVGRLVVPGKGQSQGQARP